MEVLTKLDIVQILSIGISGFGFLLILLAFLLIYKEQKREAEPRQGILGIIKFFMGLNIVNIVIVGIISLPTINNLGKALVENDKLAQVNSESKAIVQFLDAGRKVDSMVLGNLSVTETIIDDKQTAAVIQTFTTSLDSLQKHTHNKAVSDSIQQIKDDLTQYVKAVEAGTLNDTSSNKRALENVVKNRGRIEKIVKGKDFKWNE